MKVLDIGLVPLLVVEGTIIKDDSTVIDTVINAEEGLILQ